MSSTQDDSPGSETFEVGSLEVASELNPTVGAAVGNRYSVEVASDAKAVEALRPVWRTWTNSLDTDLDFFLHQLSQDSGALAPYVITVYDEGNARAMLVGQIRKQRAATVVSLVNIAGPTMRVLKIKKGGRMGPQSEAIDKLLAMELLKAARSGRVDSICLERLPLHSELFRQIQHLPDFLVQERVPHVFCYSELSLSNSGKDYQQVFSGKIMREMRRKTRIVERAFPGEVSLKCFSQPTEVDTGICEAMRVAVTTWQHSLGQGFKNTAQTRETFQFCAQQGWLRIYILYIKDAPCAFLAGQLYNNNFYCQYAGYHPDYTHFSVGSILTARVFEELAAAGVQRVDLGEGGQEHNRRVGCQMVEEGTVHVYSPSLRGVWLNLFFGTTQIVRVGGRRARSALRLDWMAKIWGQYLLSRRGSRNSLLGSSARP